MRAVGAEFYLSSAAFSLSGWPLPTIFADRSTV